MVLYVLFHLSQCKIIQIKGGRINRPLCQLVADRDDQGRQLFCIDRLGPDGCLASVAHFFHPTFCGGL